MSTSDPATSTSDYATCVHCCWDATYSAPNTDWNDSSSTSSTHSAINTSLIFRTNPYTNPGFCSKRNTDTKHTYRADCSTGSSYPAASDPSSAPVCANPAATPAAANICAGTATWHSSKYQRVAFFFLCSGVPHESSLCIAPCCECLEPVLYMVVNNSFYFRAKGALFRCVKMCIQMFLALFEGGGHNE